MKFTKPQAKLLAKLRDLSPGEGRVAVARPTHDRVSLRAAESLKALGLVEIRQERIDFDYMSRRYVVRLCADVRSPLVSPPKHGGDPMFQANGLFYFWDQLWSSIHGPFVDQREAESALLSYARSL